MVAAWGSGFGEYSLQPPHPEQCPQAWGHGSATASLGPTDLEQQGALTLGGLQYWGGGGGRIQPSQHGSDGLALSKPPNSNWDFSFITNQTVLR